MNSSVNNILIRNQIKRILKKNGYTYKDLAQTLEITETTVKRLMVSGDFTTSRLETIAEWFGMDFFDFIVSARDSKQDYHHFSKTEEEFLSQNLDAFYVILLLGMGFSPGYIKRQVAPSDIRPILLKLDKSGLIELHENDKIRLKFRGPFYLLPDGPLRECLSSRVADHLCEVISHQEEKFLIAGENYYTEELYNQLCEEMTELDRKFDMLCRTQQETVSENQFFPVLVSFCSAKYPLWKKTLIEEP